MNFETISQFPVTSYLNEICGKLKQSESRFLVLTAETGAGKSTILPLGLLENFSGKILMTEPRRLAVLGVANRVSSLLQEDCGKTAGYKIHLENKTSKDTRLEIITEAILVRYLQNDPSLDGISVVVIDEFHERSIYTDLNLAFLKEAMELRDDLFVIIMSATIDTEKITNYLATDKTVPVMNIPGRLFPVQIEYKPNLSVENAIFQEITKTNKSEGILVFLPGIKEIRNCENKLKEKLDSQNSALPIEISFLHSSISLAEQKYVLAGGNKQAIRIILASAIAETSLTVPRITCVIDSGLSRINRINVSTGMENLVTEPESDFSAEQRCGRAGRERAGRCVRLWPEFEPRIKEMPPEIRRADLTTLVLECADRGIFNPNGIDWLDKPGENAWNGCTKLLKDLLLLRSDGRITEKGKAVLSLGIHVRLGCIALEGKLLGKEKISEKLILSYSSYDSSSAEVKRNFCVNLEQRLSKINLQNFKDTSLLASSENLLILAGFPDRLAKRLSEIGAEKAIYQFPSGRKALLSENKIAPEWIVAPEVLAGTTEGIIFSFETPEPAEIYKWLENHREEKNICSFEGGKIKKIQAICFGEIILSEKIIPAEKEDLLNAWIHEIHKKGMDCLPMDKKTEAFITRAKFYYQQTNKEFPQIENRVEEWLPSFLGTSSKLTAEILYDALYWFLDGQTIDASVPAFYKLPNNSKCKIEYKLQSSTEDKNLLVYRPVIEVIIQRIFGCKVTPQIMGMKVLLYLLSPASRPLQITDDLEGFWTSAWPEICKEMKGRYPKHCWDSNVICD